MPKTAAAARKIRGAREGIRCITSFRGHPAEFLCTKADPTPEFRGTPPGAGQLSAVSYGVIPEDHETVLSQSNLLSSPYGIDVLDACHLVVSSLNNARIVSIALADGAQTLIAETNGMVTPTAQVPETKGTETPDYETPAAEGADRAEMRGRGRTPTPRGRRLPQRSNPMSLAVELKGSLLD